MTKDTLSSKQYDRGNGHLNFNSNGKLNAVNHNIDVISLDEASNDGHLQRQDTQSLPKSLSSPTKINSKYALNDDEFDSSNKSLAIDSNQSDKEKEEMQSDDDQEMKALKLKLLKEIEPADDLYHSKNKWDSKSPPILRRPPRHFNTNNKYNALEQAQDSNNKNRGDKIKLVQCSEDSDRDDEIKISYLSPIQLDQYTHLFKRKVYQCYKPETLDTMKEYLQYISSKQTINTLVPPDFKSYLKTQIVSPQLQFDSNFESGNLESAFMTNINSYNYKLLMKVDSNTKGNSYWFHYKVKNFEVGTTV